MVTSYQQAMEFSATPRSPGPRGRACPYLWGWRQHLLPDEGVELPIRVARIYSPTMAAGFGLQGMVDDMIDRADFPLGELNGADLAELGTSNPQLVGRLVSAAENYPDKYPEVFEEIRRRAADSGAPVVGVTGTGGSGKSSLVDEVVRRYLAEYEDRTIAVVSVDPSRRRSGGALLGDRIRMNSIHHPRAYMRSLATRQPNLALSPHVQTAVDVVRAAGFDLVILETSGIGQSDTEIVDHCDLSVYVMTPEYGAATQLEKTDMLDYADLVAINKADKQGALDALRDVRKQVRRNRVQFDGHDADLPVYLTVASDFNDPATNLFYRALTGALAAKTGVLFPVNLNLPVDQADKQHVVPPSRTRYLAEIVEAIRRYDAWVEEQTDAAEDLYRLEGAKSLLASPGGGGSPPRDAKTDRGGGRCCRGAVGPGVPQALGALGRPGRRVCRGGLRLSGAGPPDPCSALPHHPVGDPGPQGGNPALPRLG